MSKTRYKFENNKKKYKKKTSLTLYLTLRNKTLQGGILLRSVK